ncbi:hypothetical protein HBB16_03230 [Pseudonocardia sp. MCCB 268]|nr:hypothetical protein [Pseudonocardia cytotoxica]
MRGWVRPCPARSAAAPRWCRHRRPRPGETKIELTAAGSAPGMSVLRREIAGRCARSGRLQRGSRRRNEVPSVVIVGYTNAGKSSLLKLVDRRRGSP